MLTRLIVLLNEAMMREVNDSHWDEVLEIRAQMQLKKKILTVVKIKFTVQILNYIRIIY